MDEISSLGIFSDDHFHDINACCLHLKVTTLSDITNGSGMHIITEALDASWASIKWKESPITIRGSHQQKMLSKNGSTQVISPHECW
jgi:hypothetical protein